MDCLLKNPVFVAAVILLVPVPSSADTWSVVTRGIDETAIVFSAEDIRERNLPARIQARNLPPIFAQQVVLSCLGIPSQPEDLLVYLPVSRRCIPYEQLSRTAQNLRSAVTQPVNLTKDEQSSLAMVLEPASSVGIAAGSCFCPIDPPPPGNKPPVASIPSGSPQEVEKSLVIEQISFKATDADDSSISHTFAYTLDNGSAIDGLPPGLSKSCTAGTGLLNCNVNGNAPDQVGVYHLKFTASDGKASDYAVATLTVFDPVQRQMIFKDGFEGSE